MKRTEKSKEIIPEDVCERLRYMPNDCLFSECPYFEHFGTMIACRKIPLNTYVVR